MISSTDGLLLEAVSAIDTWQRGLIDNPYTDTPDKPEERYYAHVALIEAARESSLELSDLIIKSTKINASILDSFPVLQHPVQIDEFNNPTRHGDECFHQSLEQYGCNRGHAMDYGWWCLLSLHLLRTDKVHNPPVYLLDRRAPNNYLFNRQSLKKSYAQSIPQERKTFDDTIRNLFRRSGGIWLRRSHWLVDSAMAGMWWRVELAKEATSQHPKLISFPEAYEALRAAWPNYAEDASRSFTRLAHSNCVAAYTILAQEYKQTVKACPKGKAAQTIIRTMMRRTNHLNICIMDPQRIADISR